MIFEEVPMTQCPVCGMMVNESTAPSLEYRGKKYYFMNPIHKDMFEKDPEKFLAQKKNMSSHG
jgi:YHS domain-containing protein